MRILHVPCLEDNYAYIIIDESTKRAAVVDPVEPGKVIEAAKKESAVLEMVLTTHHHWDHSGGNEKIKELIPGIKVFGGDLDNVPGCTDSLQNGTEISLGEIKILAHHTPCHTKGHISYFMTGAKEDAPAVFTGDTLFVAGCGKFFEGTAMNMYDSLKNLGSLPKGTRVYCGHEYTEKNLRFALTVEPNNERIKTKLEWAKKMRVNGLPTIPSTIEDELETNPFMRVDIRAIQERMNCKDPIKALEELRKRKDSFKG